MAGIVSTLFRHEVTWTYLVLALASATRCWGKMLSSGDYNLAASSSSAHRCRRHYRDDHFFDNSGVDAAEGGLGFGRDCFVDRSTWREVGGLVVALQRFAEGRASKTGTTIAGVVFQGGIVLGADTRATGGRTVCDRNCDKIHLLAANIACCGAGTSADAMRVTEGVRLALLRMALEMQACLPRGGVMTSRPGAATAEAVGNTELIAKDSGCRGVGAVQREHGRVIAAAVLLKQHLFRHQGTVSASLVLGGVDVLGPHLYQIQQGGSFDRVEFTAMGSGSLAALSTLERGHREDLREEDAKALVMSAIAAGIDNDLGSGSNIDICVITANRGVEHQRGAWMEPSSRMDETSS